MSKEAVAGLLIMGGITGFITSVEIRYVKRYSYSNAARNAAVVALASAMAVLGGLAMIVNMQVG